MSAKDNAALGQLLELLEARYALRVLWALKDGHPQTFRLLQDSIGQITPNTLNSRIKELRAAGLLDHRGEGYVVTYLARTCSTGSMICKPLPPNGRLARPNRAPLRLRQAPKNPNSDAPAPGGKGHKA
jgi:DNA-binding transcriptional ArsR family regulator